MPDPTRQTSDQGDAAPRPAARGAAVVATPGRWAASTAAMTAAFAGLVAAYVSLSHSGRTLASFGWVLLAVFVGVGAVLWPLFRAEESRLARELRIARTGGPALRAMVARRRQEAPLFGRLLSTQIGAAAVLLADGDRAEAVRVFARTSPLMRGGRLGKLRAVVDADMERALGSPARFDESARKLRKMASLGHREADLYRLHVLVKALLQRGDAVAASEVARDLAVTADDESRIYLVWLRAWFDLDGFEENADESIEGRASREESASWPPLPEGELRVAALVARAQGAEKLVHRLETRMAAIANPERRE